MLTIEQYHNLSNHVASAHRNLDATIKDECVADDGELTDLIIGVGEHLKEIEDILNFLVVKNASDNKCW